MTIASLVASLLVGTPAPAAPRPAEPARPPVEKLDSHGGPVSGRAWTQKRVKDAPAPRPVWPEAGAARVRVGATGAAGRGARAGDLPVWVARAGGAAGARLASVDVQVLDRRTLPAAWRDGLVMKVTAPTRAAPGTARVSVDYSSFRHAVGGSWASRLRLWQVPACALATPEKPGCRSVPLPTRNDLGAGVATADVGAAPPPSTSTGRAELAGEAPAPSTGTFLALAAGGSGADGDFTATSLSPSSTWSAGSSSGDFSWNYPVRTPPATGPEPSVDFAYSSASVDGRSEVTNNQPSWLGEGFDYSPGFVERRYVPCAEDKKNGANNTADTGDQCWRSHNATMSLNGRSTELVFETGKGWHPGSEDGSKIERLTGASGNGDNDGEHWKVTTSDGTQYFFGLHSLPGHTAKTNSTLAVPVFGNHSGEPCHQSAYSNSSCAQAWRWNLDYVVDVRGNTMSLWYGKETNKYARNDTDSDDVSYDRAGYLNRIDYGTYDRAFATHGVTERNVTPYAQVVFETDMRCFANCGTEAAPVEDSWKDTPWDQECKASATSCPQQYSPTFWTTKRLKKITTKVWDTTKATPAWQDVESWTLSHTFAATADSTHTGLWLDRIDHAGHVGGTVSLPPVTFEAVSMPNRVLTEHGTTDNWLRISSIVTESGSRIKVDYALPECTAAMVQTLDPHTNTRRCYPVRVPDPTDLTGQRLITEWWHKHRVEHVAEDDVELTDGHQAPSRHTWYQYVGNPAWHYADDDGLSKPDRKTWSQWRGYAQVNTRVGDDPATQTLTVTKYLRGMHGDKASPTGGTRNVTVPASLGSETVYDEDQFAGQVREQIVYNGVDTKPVSKTVNVPWRSNPTASRTVNGDTVEARFVDTQTTYKATALGVDGSRGWRTSRGTKSLDHTYGTVNWSQDDGDVDVTGDEKCITYSYNRNTGKNLTRTVKRTTTTALACGTNPSTVDDVISDARSYYDGASSVDTAPTFGSVTKTEQLKDWASGTGTVWQTTSQGSYDFTGRPVSSTDIKGNVSTTAFTPAVGGPVTKVTTTGPAPFNWTSSADTNPYWGSTVKATDPNNRVIADVEYDALGRVSKVWELGWPKAANPTTPSAQYTYTFAAARNAYPFVRAQTLNADGNYLTSYEILDGLLRPRQTQTPAADGTGARVVTDTLHDSLGRASISYGAHAEPGTPSGTLWWEPEWSLPAVSKTIFDRASRPTNTILLAGDGVTNLVEKWRTVTAHEGDLTKVTPPQGGTPTTTVTDAEGRVVKLRQHTTAAGVGGAYQETQYVFDRKGQQVKTIDPAGNQWVNEYDAKGRLWRSTDPDKGVTVSTFNDADELVTTTDARGEVLWHGYDVLGRKKELRDDSATGALRTEWKYDTLYTGQGGFRGQLTQAIRYEPAGSTNAYRWQVRNFDDRYQPKGVNYVIPTSESGLNGTYVYTYGYSAATGAPTSISYPAAGGLVTEEVTTDYDATTGMPVALNTSLTGSAGTMATASYTAYGERSGSMYKLPGGVYAKDVVERYEATRRVKRTTVHRENVAGTVSDRNYYYDDSGNFTSIEEKPEVGQADTQCFRSDPLGQLRSAWTPKAGVTCQTDPTVANLGGPAPYWLEWTFNSTASRTIETSHAAGGDTTRTYAVPVGGQDVVRPHAVTAMTTEAPGQSAVVTNYTYDATGNTTCRPAGTAANNCGTGANSQTLGWDAEGKLATVSAGGQTVETNIYDADGTRIIRRDSSGTTLYLPGQEIRREGTVNTGTRYYSFAGNVCASRKGGSASTDLTWLYHDHQGTQQTAINAGTQAVSIRRQTPYGAPRGANPTWANNKGFVGGDIDPTGLTNVGARQYDPILGRFISVDPVLMADDPDQYNAYQYGGNNPVDNADPTGLYHTENSEDTGDRAYVTTTSTGERSTKIVKKYVPPACGSSCQAQREAFRQASNERAEAARKQRECQASFWCRSGKRAKSTAAAGWNWAKENADVVGVVAGVAVGLTCTVITGGSGALLCGALGGAVSGLVAGGLKCAGGDESRCSAGSLALDTGAGALLGIVGGAAGTALGGAFGGLVGGGLRGVAPGAGSALTTLGRGTVAAARQGSPALISRAIGGSTNNNLGTFFRGSVQQWSADAAKAGGGVKGHAAIALGTGRMVLQGAVSPSGLSAGVVGAVAPTTRDDVVQLVNDGYSFNPMTAVPQIAGGLLGGGF
ncbi:RHS repeat-associated core domain-containing protein [Micromonospora nigra]|uniref:RHS repeat-associated core domain-containing protein n=1 Tax=Micromonospora nigra TaxID=145857 RepID=A0A1C6RU86_9ACTN|nr:RHS repeat-associated core domain-containing protein [Micromonospora nigra]SCL20781.1 RHS repeat-associated core domain-containing protein [Micromonospora nigra]